MKELRSQYSISAEVEVIEVPTARNDYTDGYDERIAEIEREKAEHHIAHGQSTLCFREV